MSARQGRYETGEQYRARLDSTRKVVTPPIGIEWDPSQWSDADTEEAVKATLAAEAFIAAHNAVSESVPMPGPADHEPGPPVGVTVCQHGSFPADETCPVCDAFEASIAAHNAVAKPVARRRPAPAQPALGPVNNRRARKASRKK